VLRASDGRWHDVSVDNDGAARCATARLEFDADGNVTRVTSKPAPARADDGARVEGASAGAKEGHGWSVSATRTIGNVAQVDSREVARIAEEMVAAHYEWMNQRWRDIATGTLRPRAADLDAARDAPVMPDETPLADMAKPDDVFAELAAWAAKEMVAPSPLSSPTLVQLPRDPSPGVCPACRVQRRERGEVRVHYWKCSCPVRPESVEPIDNLRWVGRGYHCEGGWCADGHGARATHPTEAGAVSAWREALANAQREEDA
jgi:hypothetical protein